MAKFRIPLKRAFILSPLMLIAFACHADSIITLTDGTAAFTVDTGSSAGMSTWTLNSGPNVMPQQWFWFRTGSGPLQSLDTLGTPSIFFDPSFPDFADIQYQSSTLSADLTLDLVDGTPAVMSEQLQFSNLLTNSVSLTIIQYLHFQFSPSLDSAAISGNDATQHGALGSVQIGSAPFGSLYQVSPASVLLSDLTGSTSSTFNLNNQASGSGDVAIAFEWQVTLPANGSTILSIDESLTGTPEPASMLLLGAGVASLYGFRSARRRKA